MKTYVKPALYFESFELSQHIAACDLKLDHSHIWDCAVELHQGGSTSPFFGDLENDFVDAFVDNGSCKKKCEIYCYTNGANYLPHFFNS